MIIWVACNAAIQFFLFIFLAHIPAYRTKRMSYVDIAWPLGLVAIGIIALVFTPTLSIRSLCVSTIYILIGGRMGTGALWMWSKGVFNREFPRYQYQRLRWQRVNRDVNFAMHREIFIQLAANCTVLTFPAFVQIANVDRRLSWIEIIGYVMWAFFFIIESVADWQKQRFIATSSDRRHEVCDVGLWRYSRHPNYFAEWMVWNSLILATLPSCYKLWQQQSSAVTTLLLSVGCLLISRIMYVCLVHYTGARPAEHFSLQKRPGYKAYMVRTNQFFPGLPRM